MEKQYIIPIFIPNTDNQDSYMFGYKDNITRDKAKKIIDNHLKNLDKENAKIEIDFLGGNFISINKDIQNELLETAYTYIKNGLVESIRISTTPTDINKSTLKRLKKYKVKTIELIVHSSNDYILQKSNMNYNFNDVKKACKLIKWNGFKLCLQMVVGLPESTRIDEINTAKALIKLKPKIVKIYPILVIKNTKLEKDYNDEKYEPLPLVQAIEICKELVRMFYDRHIEIMSVGAENIFEPDNIVAGPYHPAFRQLVESSMWYDAIVGKIKKLNVKVKEVEVTVNPIDSNSVIGFNKENAIKLKDIYDVDLILKQDEKMKQGKSKIEITKTYHDFLEESENNVNKKEPLKRS